MVNVHRVDTAAANIASGTSSAPLFYDNARFAIEAPDSR
jgi:hypothetical protein